MAKAFSSLPNISQKFLIKKIRLTYKYNGETYRSKGETEPIHENLYARNVPIEYYKYAGFSTKKEGMEFARKNNIKMDNSIQYNQEKVDKFLLALIEAKENDSIRAELRKYRYISNKRIVHQGSPAFDYRQTTINIRTTEETEVAGEKNVTFFNAPVLEIYNNKTLRFLTLEIDSFIEKLGYFIQVKSPSNKIHIKVLFFHYKLILVLRDGTIQEIDPETPKKELEKEYYKDELEPYTKEKGFGSIVLNNFAGFGNLYSILDSLEDKEIFSRAIIPNAGFVTLTVNLHFDKDEDFKKEPVNKIDYDKLPEDEKFEKIKYFYHNKNIVVELDTDINIVAKAVSKGSIKISGVDYKIFKETILYKKIYLTTFEERLAHKFPSVKNLYAIVGFDFSIFEYSEEKFETYAKHIKAYAPSQSASYHKETLVSTSKNGTCIYESWLYITENIMPKDIRIKEMISKENEQVRKMIRGGELVNFLQYKMNEDDTAYVKYFKQQGNECGFKITKNSVELITDNVLFNGKIVYLYYLNHVAPCLIGETEYKAKKSFEEWSELAYDIYQKDYNIAKKGNNTKKLDIIVKKMNNLEHEYERYSKDYKENVFELHPIKMETPDGLTGYDPLGNIILAFDFECYKKDIAGEQIPYCVCLYGLGVKKSFYGPTCTDDFIDHIFKKYVKETSTSKTNSKKKIKNVKIYGYNNSAYDNAFIFTRLFERNRSMKYVISGSTIKYMKCFNVSFYDIKLYYASGLAKVAKSFKLPVVKGVFPYNFVNKDNLNYVGPIPDVKLWKNSKDLEEYKKLESNSTFDMKKYTIKYCLLDCELVYKIAELHIEQSRGKINGRLYNGANCPTSASLSLLIFQSCFLSTTLKSSPMHIQKIERECYKGGRTEVFRKEFISNGEGHYLFYYDINSSYPYAMTELMPYEFKETIERSGLLDLESIRLTSCYYVKSTYKSNDKHYIPNLLTRSEHNDIIASKNTNYSWHWGVEIKEAILSGCEIEVLEEQVYYELSIFKDFAEFMYEERLKCKKSAPAKAEFLKLCMNSLYGKMGQFIKTYNKLCTDIHEINNITNNKDLKYVDYKEINEELILIEFCDFVKDKQSIGNLVRFASYIAAVARTNLAKMMRLVGYEHIYYCDTDSIFCDAKPPTEMLDNNKLGLWKLEAVKNKITDEEEPALITKAVFLAPKTYHYETANSYCNKAKGHRSDDITSEHYDEVLNGHQPQIKNDAMFFRSLTGVKVHEQTRSLNTTYNKRIWNGNTSEAYTDYKDWYDNKYIIEKNEKKEKKKMEKQKKKMEKQNIIDNYISEISYI